MTRDEFEQGYAARSGCTVSEIRDLGLIPVPCDCGYEFCAGWVMEWPSEREARRLRSLIRGTA